MEFTALVALKSRIGELTAVRRHAGADFARVQPLIEVLHNVRADSLVLGDLADTAWSVRQAGRPVMLDVSQLHPASRLWDHPGGPFRFLAEALLAGWGLTGCELQDVDFIPVVRANESVDRVRQTAELLDELGRGAAVRVTNAHHADVLATVRRTLHALRAPAHEVDLIVDVSYLDGAVLSGPVRALRGRLDLLLDGGFRSATLLSGSIPPSRRLLRSGRCWARPEFLLWCDLGRCRTVRYGDYGVAHPQALDFPTSVRRSARHPFLHYTLPQRSQYFRHELPMLEPTSREGVEADHKARHFADLAVEVLAQHPAWLESWGDRVLRRCAEEGLRVTAPRDWVAIGTSHHVAHLAAQADLHPDDRSS